jgi:hypothetical protein
MRASIDRALDFLDEAKLHTVPMAVGSADARAVAKDYANSKRLIQYELGKTSPMSASARKQRDCRAAAK